MSHTRFDVAANEAYNAWGGRKRYLDALDVEIKLTLVICYLVDVVIWGSYVQQYQLEVMAD